MKITGHKQLIKQFRNLQDAGVKRAQKKAARTAATVLARTMRPLVPVDLGLTRRATTSKVSNGKRYGIQAMAGASTAKLDGLSKMYDRPSNIDWLINEGHVMPDGTVVPPEGYRERAQDAAAGPAEAAYAAKLAAEIEREAMRG